MKHLSQGFMQGALAIVLTCGFFGVLWLLTGKADMRDALLILVGALGRDFGSMVNWYYGSSKSSARKDELLANSSGAVRISTDSYVKIRNSGDQMCKVVREVCTAAFDGEDCRAARALWRR